MNSIWRKRMFVASSAGCDRLYAVALYFCAPLLVLAAACSSDPLPPTGEPTPTSTALLSLTPTVESEPTSTPAATPTPIPTPAPTATSVSVPPYTTEWLGLANARWLDENQPELAASIKSLPWLADGVEDGELAALQALVNLETSYGSNMSPVLAQQAWIVNGINEHDVVLLEVFENFSKEHKDDALQVITLPVADTADASVVAAFESLMALASISQNLLRSVMQEPWVQDGLNADEGLVLRTLGAISAAGEEDRLWIATLQDYERPTSFRDGSLGRRFDVGGDGVIDIQDAILAIDARGRDEISDEETSHVVALYAFGASLIPLPQLTSLVQAAPWHRDGLQQDDFGTEQQAVWALDVIGGNSPVLAGAASRWPWIYDATLTYDEMYLLERLSVIVEHDPAMASHIVELSWLYDGVTYWEAEAIYAFSKLAESGATETSIALAATPWVLDGVTSLESEQGISGVAQIATSEWLGDDAEYIARSIMAMTSQPPTVLDHYFIDAMARYVGGYNPLRRPRQLLEAPWFADGLDDKERVYVITHVGPENLVEEYADYVVDQRLIELPLAGSVHLWAVQPKDTESRKNTLDELEQAVRGVEQFWQIPFPVENVMLYMKDSSFRSRFVGKGMIISADYEPGTIAHETAHYYFNQGPSWLSEGGAEITVSFIENDRTIPTVSFPRFCAENGIENIRDLNELDSGWIWSHCLYPIGMHFLSILRETMGEEAWSSALRAFFSQYKNELKWHGFLVHPEMYEPDDQDFYKVVLAHAPSRLVDDVNRVFRRWHGGSFINSDSE